MILLSDYPCLFQKLKNLTTAHSSDSVYISAASCGLKFCSPIFRSLIPKESSYTNIFLDNLASRPERLKLNNFNAL